MSAELTGATRRGAVTVEAIELVRHKAGRRALLRYDLAGIGRGHTSTGRLYAKTFASERGLRVHQVTRTIAGARGFGPDVAVPEPVAFLPHLKLLVQRAVPGVPIVPALLAGDCRLAIQIATALHRLHTSDLKLDRTHTLAAELSPLRDRAAQIAAACPELSSSVTKRLARIERDAGRAWPWRVRPLHRDFYHDQLLAENGRLAVLDLDDAAMSEPAVDVANFAAHLRLLAVQRPGHHDALAAVEHAFLDCYLSLDPALNAVLLRFLTATTLLRLAGIHVTRTDGPRIAGQLLDESRRLLD